MVVSWFSAGVSSAVATKIANPDRIIYIDIDDQHPDTMRFIRDCESWFNKPIEIIRSSRFRSVAEVCYKVAFINGPSGAACSSRLKKEVRKNWERENPGRHAYVWGFDANERGRVERIIRSMPEYDHEFPIIEKTKEEVHGILRTAGIKRPEMYDLGYHNNNCIGCVKGGAGYWNKIRIDFPHVFMARAQMERDIGARMLKTCYLDELGPEAGRNEGPIVPECGLFCEINDRAAILGHGEGKP